MKIKFNRDTINKAEGDIKDKLKKLFSEPALLSEVAEVAIKDIKFQAKRGKNPITGGSFIPLSKKWIEQRGRIDDVTPTDEAYRQNRSNITLTGQLLNSLSKRIVNKARSTAIWIYFAGMHKPYKVKGRNGQLRDVGKPISNDKLSGYVNELRPFFYLRESLLPRLKSVVIRYIRRKL